MMAEMGQFIGEAMQAGVLVARVHSNRKECASSLPMANSLYRRPFIELKELTASFAVIQASSLEETTEWCKRFRKIVEDGESEIVQLFGPDDFAHG